jgi:hypothetical protein
MMMEENYRTALSLKNSIVPEPFPDMKIMVEEVLESQNMALTRPANMDIPDILSLLAAFNSRDIHFA